MPVTIVLTITIIVKITPNVLIFNKMPISFLEVIRKRMPKTMRHVQL